MTKIITEELFAYFFCFLGGQGLSDPPALASRLLGLQVCTACLAQRSNFEFNLLLKVPDI